MVSAMTVQTQLEPQVDERARLQGAPIFRADPELRVQPVLSMETPAGSLWPAFRKMLRLVVTILGGLLALILLSFMLETH